MTTAAPGGWASQALMRAEITTAFVEAGGIRSLLELVVTHLEKLLDVIVDPDGELRVVVKDGRTIGDLIARLKNEKPRLFEM